MEVEQNPEFKILDGQNPEFNLLAKIFNSGF